MSKKSLLIAAVAILVIAIIGITYLLFTEKQANRELVQEFQLDKEDLENEYTRFAQQYDELKMTISNDSLSQLLEQEQLKTQRLLEELRTVKSTNATEIRRLKNELATLRKVMIGYINQIDSLNKLTAQQNPNIRVQETLKPVAIFERPDGKYILDMGQNMVGWLSVDLKGKKDKPVSMKFAELLQKDGSLYLANLRTAQVTDVYTPAEDGDFSWQPRFVYHGFRFVEVSGLDYKPELSAFTGHVIYDEMTTTRTF